MQAVQQQLTGCPRIYQPAEIRMLLKQSDKAVERGVLAIYRFQEESEKNSGISIANNNVGFNRFDAPFMSSIAKQLLMKEPLTPSQVSDTRVKLLKYAGQLTRIANKVQV